MQFINTHVKSTTGKTKPPTQPSNTGTKVHNEILSFQSSLLHFSLITELFTVKKKKKKLQYLEGSQKRSGNSSPNRNVAFLFIFHRQTGD